MSGIGAAEAIGILAIFLGGIALGVIAIVAAAIRREEHRFSLGRTAPDFLTQGARMLIGVGSRGERTWER